MKYNDLVITTKEAEDMLFSFFNIKGKASKLRGEIDFNFKIKSDRGNEYLLKISRPDEDDNYLDFQQKLLQHLEVNKLGLIVPKVIKDKNDRVISDFKDQFGKQRKVRLLTWISGRVWSDVNPQLDDLRFSLGEQCGLLTKELQGFDHHKAHRNLEWDIAQSLWTKAHIHLFRDEEKGILSTFQRNFELSQKAYSKLRKSVVHNDANDNNIIVSHDLLNPKVTALIDYGDAFFTQIINDVAIACAYAIMGHIDPLAAALPIIKGYHFSFPLKEEEMVHLYNAIAMRLVISLTKSAINKIKEPDNKYLLISEKSAWEVLKKWYSINPEFACFSFRQACGFTAHPNEEKFKSWALKNNVGLKELFPSVKKNKIEYVDLSVSSKWIGHERDFNDLDLFQFKINKLQAQSQDKIIAGGYLEPRALYTSTAYDKIGNNGRESRTIHLGIDFWLPALTPIHALFDGEIVTAVNDAGDKEYGGLVIIKHSTETFDFYTLYGHLTVESALKNNIGDKIKKGDRIAVLGNYPENGNWAPHLHFQLMLSMLDYQTDFPGVTYLNQIEIWKSICPDPNMLFKNETLSSIILSTNNELIDYRKKHLGKSLSLQYNVPIRMVRGAGQYMLDQFGKKYLDTVNNVAHVGHENYDVVKVGQEQMALLNTNSRYLHENINKLASELLKTLPPELSVFHFVNSGSEANELAIRMVKAVTGQRDIIASEVGYHGNSNMCVDISSYKFDGKGGSGAPEHTHIIPLPDVFRGKHRGNNAGDLYAEEVKKQLNKIKAKGRNIGGFIIEPIISCGGQIKLPKGFLTTVYKYIKEAGGLCISDEVQTGCGRMGKTFWGFQLFGVVPDIVTIGKPLGNGHPLAAVACTQEVAEKFANGMEYFNTFGGNPVSCAIGTEVLKIVIRDKLQENALNIGEFLKDELRKLAIEFPIIGDVRGQGLFLGIEFVDFKLNPLAEQADYLVNRMKDYGILVSTDGPARNVLKIKPPMVFNKENAVELIFYLRKILAEDFMKFSSC